MEQKRWPVAAALSAPKTCAVTVKRAVQCVQHGRQSTCSYYNQVPVHVLQGGFFDKAETFMGPGRTANEIERTRYLTRPVVAGQVAGLTNWTPRPRALCKPQPSGASTTAAFHNL